MNEAVRVEALAASTPLGGELWPLPPGWAWAKVGDAAAVNPATSFDDLPPQAEISFIPMAAVGEETGIIKLTARRRIEAVAKGYVRFRQGDVIFAKITPCMENGKVAPVPTLDGGVAAGSTEFHVLRPCAVDQHFLWYWLVSRAFRGRAKRHMSGSAGQLRVPTEYLRDAPLPVPPLTEQRRIVARIGTLFAEVGNGEVALQAACDGLKTFRRTLLKAAITGDLTKDWREINRTEESGHELLTRIRAERAIKASVRRRARRGSHTSPPNQPDLPNLPESWVWCGLGDLLVHLTSGSRDWANYYDRGDKIFVMAQNVRSGRYNHDLVKYVDPPPHLKDVERSRIRQNDLLITIVGANTGDVCRVDFEAHNYFVCQSVALMRPILPEISAYLELYLVAPDGGRGQMETVVYGAGRPHLSFDNIEELMVPLPPPAEMAEILCRVSNALAAHDDTQIMLDTAAGDAARLRQSILKAAFEGRLLPQDPADEPASVLLARVATEKTAPVRARRGRPAGARR